MADKSGMDRPQASPAARPLPSRQRPPLSPQQQLDAARQVFAQAEQRIALSKKLFDAAEARTVHNQKLLEQFKAAQDELRRELHEDVAASLRDYDQWMGRIDEGFTRKMRELHERLDRLETQWGQAQQQVEDMMLRAQSLLEQSKGMLDAASPSPSAAEPTAPDDAGGVAKPQAAQRTDPVDASPIYSQLLRRLRERAGDEEAA